MRPRAHTENEECVMDIGSLFNVPYFINVIPKLVTALPATLAVLLSALLGGLALGFVAAALKINGNKVVSAIAYFYISFMRGVPLIALMLLIYFGFPQLMTVFGIPITSWPKLPLVTAGFALNVSGYLAENMRSAYLAVDKSQFEAAQSIGMSGLQTFIYIIFPQAFVIALPSVGNTVIMLIKDTSLAFALGIVDIMGKAVLINARNFGARQMEIYLAVGLLYWAICFVLEKIISYFEKHGRQTRLCSE